MAWWIWLLLGMFALAGEAAITALFLLYVGIAAIAAAVLGLLGIPLAMQVAAFAAITVGLLGLVRPRMLNALARQIPRRTLTNQGPLMERPGTVIKTVTADGGTIQVGTADYWSARAAPPVQRIEAGQPVRVVYVDGLTAYVSPLPSQGTPQ